MADIDAIERLLCQRYNVQALDAGELSAALALARGGDLQPLRDALGARELYRWEQPIREALDAETEQQETPEAEPEAVDEPADEQPVALDEDAPEVEPEAHRRGRRR